MALIVGYTTPEEREKLQRAGYEVHKYTGQNLIHPHEPAIGNEITVAVTVDCEILELLAPNFCSRCGSLVEDVQTYYNIGSRIKSYHCTVCNSLENHILFPLVKEDK